MRQSFVRRVVFLAALMGLPAIGLALFLDVTLAGATNPQGPVVVSAAFSPTAVNTASGPASVTVTLQVTDGPSGFATADLGFLPPSGGYRWFYPSWTLSTGTPQDGTYTATIQLPQYAATGTWTLAEIVAYDNADNWGYQTGYGNPTLQVTGGNANPPAVESAVFTPRAVNTSSGPATVTVTLQVTDSPSGFATADLGLLPPSGGYDWLYPSWTLSTGTPQDGTFTATIQLPQYATTGTWNLDELVAYDNAGNWKYETGYVVPTLQVADSVNAQAPAVQSASFSPTALNTSSGPATVTVTLQVTDGPSGFATADLGLLPPSGGYDWLYPSWTLSTGTPQDGTFTATIQLPQYATAGTWTLAEIVAYDNADNWGYQTGYGDPTLQVSDESSPTAPVITNIPSNAADGESFVPTVNTTGDGATSVTSSSASVCSVSSGTVDFVGVGTCTLTAHLAPGTNYTGADGSPQSFPVGPSLGACGNPAVTRCFTSATGTTVTVGSGFTFPVTTAGTPAPKITEKGKLPKGVKFTKGTGSASLRGTPRSTKHKSAAGTYSITFTATYGKGKSKQVITQSFIFAVAG